MLAWEQWDTGGGYKGHSQRINKGAYWLIITSSWSLSHLFHAFVPTAPREDAGQDGRLRHHRANCSSSIRRSAFFLASTWNLSLQWDINLYRSFLIFITPSLSWMKGSFINWEEAERSLLNVAFSVRCQHLFCICISAKHFVISLQLNRSGACHQKTPIMVILKCFDNLVSVAYLLFPHPIIPPQSNPGSTLLCLLFLLSPKLPHWSF